MVLKEGNSHLRIVMVRIEYAKRCRAYRQRRNVAGCLRVAENATAWQVRGDNGQCPRGIVL